MKKLSRMLLIHWHNYVKEVIEFDDINFLTGKTAAGKSTIIDALQLIILGDTNGSFFNKAANQKSSRTLKSYLFGEKGDDGDAGFRYMRNERFTGYVALEFEDTQRDKRFVTGIVCDCYKDQSFDYKWFVIHSNGFPDNLFVDEKTKTPYDIKGLKAFLSNWTGSAKNTSFEFFDTNKRYQEVTLGKFGQIKNKYRVLLKKAVPFSPISDIEQFITESICDVKNQVNVEQMQSDIHQYKNLEADAQRTQKRIESLHEISRLNREYEGEKEKYQQQKFVYMRAGKEEFVSQESVYKERVDDKKSQMEENRMLMTELQQELESLRRECEQLEQEYHTSDIVQQEKNLKQQQQQLQSRIAELEGGLHNVVKLTRDYGNDWSGKLKQLASIGFLQGEEAEFEAAAGLLSQLSAMDAAKADGYSFVQASKKFDVLKEKVNCFQVELQMRGEQLKEGIVQLETTVTNLKKGIKPYPYEVTALKRVLEEELFRQHHKAVSVEILADLLEIPRQRWRNAIEGYLDKQKFYLLVPEAYYQDCLRIYNREKKDKRIHDVGLVDTGRLKNSSRRAVVPGSLAEEIETQDEDARFYADYLLGGVMKCDNVDQLRKHKISITDEGMLYKGFVTRRINPARYASPFIGRKSMELLLAQKEAELEKQRVLYAQIGASHRIAKTAAAAHTMGFYEAEQHEKAVMEARNIAGLKSQMAAVSEEYDKLDLLYVQRLAEKIQRWKASISQKDQLRHELDKKNVRLDADIENLTQVLLPQVMGRITELQRQIDEQFEQEWVLQVGEPRFQQECRGDRRMDALQSGFYSAMRQTEIKKERLRRERTEKRSQYNGEYKMPFDIELEGNEPFDKELESLEDIRLPEYIEKIKDSRIKAYTQFRDDFIAKIRSNIETVSQQINELNASLKQSVFGTDSYRFEKKPRPEYRPFYDMIMDPMMMDTGGWNLASENFNQKYQKEIDQLFQLLILNETNVSAERRAEYEKSVRKFTDYKTYLFFDLVVTNDQGEEQRLSKTLLKKSGGETQIPFYIALLASFSQVCRIRSKNQNNTIRLIILDEAFSKMDGERIQESIHLLRRFKLQAIFSAPPEKIPDIASLVDRNIAVYKDKKHSFTRNFDPREIDEELLDESV